MGTKQTNLRLDLELIAKYKELAEDEDRPVAYHMHKALAEYPKLYSKSPTVAPKPTKSPTPKTIFCPPAMIEVHGEMLGKGLAQDEAINEAEKFINFYESKGWMVGKNKMKSWKAAVGNWLKGYKEPKGYQTAREKSAARNADIFNYEKATQF